VIQLVVPEHDIWPVANLLIREHGRNADREAVRLQDLMIDRGDDEGRLVWARIRRAIEALQAPPSSKPSRRRASRETWGRLLDLGLRDLALGGWIGWQGRHPGSQRRGA
jgi:hypothetical protein